MNGVFVGGNTQGCQYCSSPGNCGPCRLTVAQGVSASSAQLYREFGTISVAECSKFAEDSEKVRNRQMSLEDFKANLVAGRYYDRQDNGFCAQLVAQSADLAESTTIDSIPWSKVRRPKIRKLTSSGGYSSITKLYIKPSIPFRISFNGQTVDVSVMTLFHPSPIRIENVQHDAVLTLGDAGDTSSKLVVLIPLSGSVSPGPESQFIGRIASYIPGLLRPNPASGAYETINAPTGKDWNLSMILPGTPSNGETVISKGYFAWGSSPALEEYEKNRIIRPMWFPDTIQYGWRPASNQSTQFIMLKDPFPISTYDLQSIRMLDPTPAEEAIPPILPNSVVYTTATQCSTVLPIGIGATRESFENEAGRCDPFAAIPQKSFDERNTIGALSVFAIVVGLGLVLWFALQLATNPKAADIFKGWGETAGSWFAKASLGEGPAPGGEGKGTFTMTNPMKSLETSAEKRAAKEAADKETKRLAAEDAAKKATEEAARKQKDKAAADAALARVTGPGRQLTPEQQAQKDKLDAAKKQADQLAKEAEANKAKADADAKRAAEEAAAAKKAADDERKRIEAERAAALSRLSDAELDKTAKAAQSMLDEIKRQTRPLNDEMAAAGTALDNAAAMANTQAQQDQIARAQNQLEAAEQAQKDARQAVVAIVSGPAADNSEDALRDVQEQVARANDQTQNALTAATAAALAPVRTLTTKFNKDEQDYIDQLATAEDELQTATAKRVANEKTLSDRLLGKAAPKLIDSARALVQSSQAAERVALQKRNNANAAYEKFKKDKRLVELSNQTMNAFVEARKNAPVFPSAASSIPAIPPVAPSPAPAPAPARPPPTNKPVTTAPKPPVIPAREPSQPDPKLEVRFTEATADLDNLRAEIAKAEKELKDFVATRDKQIAKLPKVTPESPPQVADHGRQALRVLRSDQNDAIKSLEDTLSKLRDEAQSIVYEAQDIQKIKNKPEKMFRAARMFVGAATEELDGVKELRKTLNEEEDSLKKTLDDYEKTLGGGTTLSLREAQKLNTRAEVTRKEAWKKGGKTRRHKQKNRHR